MVCGCGIDVEEINRFTKHLDLENPPPSLIADIFTDEEILINGKSQKELRFPLGFSCKESVFKAFGVSWTNSPISWKNIELIFIEDTLDKYTIRLNGYAEELFQERNIKKIESFMEYNETYVLFQVVLIGEDL
jgi:phosphopantetheine--protein transferase-like protein